MPKSILIGTLITLLPMLAWAQENVTASTVEVTDWKAVFGRIEARDQIPARSRLGGTLVEVSVVEGSKVGAGQEIGRVVDEKLALQLSAVDATLSSLTSQLQNAEAEVARGENLLERGVTTAQRLDALRTQVDVIRGQIGAAQAERNVLEQREAEGAILAPIEGTVLTVPVTAGSVVMPGEVIAHIGGGGFYLRLAVPERHAMYLNEGDTIRIESPDGEQDGRLAKVYPQIQNGRVIADVDVPELETDFVDARVLVRLPVATSSAIVVPENALTSRMGLDFVAVKASDGTIMPRTVVVGSERSVNGELFIEILSGLEGGEQLVTGHE